ncbi:hypothetical protein G8J22_02245 [Lentilactobacillus hilgardii]|nr:hypothetical protein HMPREF0497_1763 [Lentilactobacillus buchneri ATCC 11577]QIR10238.1 hypothetical protein G8J22_02245 [Lentilactobacillus hilgardii]
MFKLRVIDFRKFNGNNEGNNMKQKNGVYRKIVNLIDKHPYNPFFCYRNYSIIATIFIVVHNLFSCIHGFNKRWLARIWGKLFGLNCCYQWRLLLSLTNYL